MQLTLEQAAERLGKSVRQVRYLIKTGGLRAVKAGPRWLIDAADLPLSDGQRAAVARRDRALHAAVDRGLGLEEPTRPRYSVRDLKAFQILMPLYHQTRDLLGAEHPAAAALRTVLLQLTQGCHRFSVEEKTAAYRAGRDAASLAVYELLLTERGEAEPVIVAIEQDLMAAFSGLLRRLDRKPRR